MKRVEVVKPKVMGKRTTERMGAGRKTGERKRGNEREGGRERDTHTQRQRERETERDRDSDRERRRERERERERVDNSMTFLFLNGPLKLCGSITETKSSELILKKPGQ